MNNYENDYLAHHGIKGQKWGIRRSREELGYPTRAKRPKRPKSEMSQKIAKHLYDTGVKLGRAAKNRYEKRKENKHNKFIKSLVNHPSRVYRNRDKLSREEITSIMNQIETNKSLRDLRAESYRNGMKKIESIANGVKTINGLVKNGTDFYNNGALLYNTLGTYRQNMGDPIPNFKPLPEANWTIYRKDKDKDNSSSSGSGSTT